MSEEVKAEQTIEDGEISDNFVEDDFTDQDWEVYTRSIEKSDGFDVVIPEKLYVMDGIVPVPPSIFEENKAEYEGWARYAIEEHNKHENKSLESVKVIKVNEENAAGVFYYFTLLVKDNEANNAAVSDLICQAKVWNGMSGAKELVLFKIVSGIE